MALIILLRKLLDSDLIIRSAVLLQERCNIETLVKITEKNPKLVLLTTIGDPKYFEGGLSSPEAF